MAARFPTVLCIDDSAQMLEERKAALESQGYSVKFASNGYHAIRALEEASVAAILLVYKQEGMEAGSPPHQAAVPQTIDLTWIV